MARDRAGLPSGVVTFLLTDIVGSTRLWEAGSRSMATAVARHEDLIRAAVEANEGVFLKHRGEGDATFSVFPSASAGVAAAADAQQSLASAEWPQGSSFAVRMAVHTGEAQGRAGDYFGRTVNRAARLRAIAEAGSVTVSQATAELVVDALPAGFVLVELGLHELRDLDRPERVYRLAPVDRTVIDLRRAPAMVSDALPRPLADEPLLGFAGRASELARIAAARRVAEAGTTRVVLVTGEPGIGKTSLARCAARLAHADGAVVAFGRCDDEIGVPYRPWVEVLNHLVGHLPIRTLERIGRRRASDLARLLPAVADRLPGLEAPSAGDADADRWALFGAVSAVFGAACEIGCLVVVLDDLHRADRATLLLLRHVVEHTEPRRLLVIGTYREQGLAADRPLDGALTRLRSDGNAERLVLTGLGDLEVVSLVERWFGAPLDATAHALIQAVYRETDGNPFFTEAMLRHLADAGSIHLDDSGRWIVPADLAGAGLPDSIVEVIGQRVTRLGPDRLRVLRVASVIGLEFDLATVAIATGRDEDPVLDALEDAEAAGLITAVGPGRFAFVHRLVASTLYAQLTPTRRERTHRDVASAIAALAAADDPTARGADGPGGPDAAAAALRPRRGHGRRRADHRPPAPEP